MLRFYVFQTECIEYHNIIADSNEAAREMLIRHLDKLWGEPERNRLMGLCTMVQCFDFAPGYKGTMYMEDSGEVKGKLDNLSEELGTLKEKVSQFFVDAVEALQS